MRATIDLDKPKRIYTIFSNKQFVYKQSILSNYYATPVPVHLWQTLHLINWKKSSIIVLPESDIKEECDEGDDGADWNILTILFGWLFHFVIRFVKKPSYTAFFLYFFCLSMIK